MDEQKRLCSFYSIKLPFGIAERNGIQNISHERTKQLTKWAYNKKNRDKKENNNQICMKFEIEMKNILIAISKVAQRIYRFSFG